jgi:hypothetical protein
MEYTHLDMLYEIKDVKQQPGEPKKRWFTDEYYDLFVWYDDQDQISSFQLTYDKGHEERALTWSRRGGFRHTGVDTGEDSPIESRSPVLVTDGIFDAAVEAERFKEESEEIDPHVARFVYSRLLRYPPQKPLKRFS